MERIAPVLSVIRNISSYTWLALFIILYLVLSVSLPVDQKNLSQLHLNIAQYRVFILSVLIPYCFIWIAGFFAYNRMQSYTRLIDGEREEPAFRRITDGIIVMAWGMVIPAVIGVILRGIAASHPSFTPAVSVINNYLMLLVPLIAFTYIGIGTRFLSDLVKHRPSYKGLKVFAFLFIALGVIYCYLTLHAWFTGGNPYHLSLPLTMITIMLPYLYVWFLGFLACYELVVYAQNIKGLLYKHALNQLTIGLGITIVSSIFIQFISIVFASDLPNLAFVLIVLYVFLALEALGFILVALGANRLKKIEEI